MIALFVTPPVLEGALEGCADRARAREAYEATHFEAKVTGIVVGGILGVLLGAVVPVLLTTRGR